jgi:hypothetical protein
MAWLHGVAIQAQEADRPGAAKIADLLKWQDEAGYPQHCLCPQRERRSQGLTAMIYQEEADLGVFPVFGAKSSGARSVPHSCRATVIPKDSRVTDA